MTNSTATSFSTLIKPRKRNKLVVGIEQEQGLKFDSGAPQSLFLAMAVHFSAAISCLAVNMICAKFGGPDYAA